MTSAASARGSRISLTMRQSTSVVGQPKLPLPSSSASSTLAITSMINPAMIGACDLPLMTDAGAPAANYAAMSGLGRQN